MSLLHALTALVKQSPATVARASAPSAASVALSALATNAATSFALPALPYDYGALEPHISGEIMKIHHTKHHQAYVTNLNIALDKYASASAAGNVAEMVALQPAIRFNGGGHINHSIFWSNLAPASACKGDPRDHAALSALIDARWGSFAAFKTAMSAAGAGVQGSGWAWLGYSKANARLEIVTCANQDPLSTGIDVWEHAYYLQYKNMRADYLAALWPIINWADVNARLTAAKL